MDQGAFKETDSYKSMSQMHRLWVDLSIAMNHGPAGHAIFERRAAPWDSEDEEIRAAWDALTHPDNLASLLGWGDGDLNQFAREATEKAIAHCRSRAGSMH